MFVCTLICSYTENTNHSKIVQNPNLCTGFGFYNYQTLVHYAKRAPFLFMGYITQVDLVTRMEKLSSLVFKF